MHVCISINKCNHSHSNTTLYTIRIVLRLCLTYADFLHFVLSYFLKKSMFYLILSSNFKSEFQLITVVLAQETSRGVTRSNRNGSFFFYQTLEWIGVRFFCYQTLLSRDEATLEASSKFSSAIKFWSGSEGGQEYVMNFAAFPCWWSRWTRVISMGEEEFVGADGLGVVALVPHVAKGELPGVGDHCCKKQEKKFYFSLFYIFLAFCSIPQ